MLFEHYVDDSRHSLISMENNNVPLPKAYWKSLGLVDIKAPFLTQKLESAESMLEISEEMFEIVPEINQLIKSSPSQSEKGEGR